MNKRFEIKQRVTPRASHSIKSYLNELSHSKYDPIPKQEELDLIKKYKTQGCEKSRDKVLHANMRFVVSVAKSYNKNKICLNLIDLIAVGNRGLLEAIDRFKVDSKNKFISYAVWWIQQKILQEIKEHSNVIRIPHNGLLIQSKRDKFVDEFYNQYGVVPNSHHISQETGIAEHSIRKIEKTQYAKHLDSFVSSEQDRTYSDLLQDDSDSIDEDYPTDKRVLLTCLMNILEEREKSIVMSFYGMKDGNKSKSLTTVGQEHSLTRERVRQIVDSAIKKLRKYILENKLQLNEYL